MSSRGDRSLLSRPAVVVAAVSSCAVVVVATLGAVTPPVLAAGLAAACAIAVISYRESQPERLIHVLRPMEEPTGPVVIRAPRAGEFARPAENHTDAA